MTMRGFGFLHLLGTNGGIYTKPTSLLFLCGFGVFFLTSAEARPRLHLCEDGAWQTAPLWEGLCFCLQALLVPRPLIFYCNFAITVQNQAERSADPTGEGAQVS